MEFEPFPPCLLPDEAEPELFPSPLPPSREELAGVDVPVFAELGWEGVLGLALALVLAVEAEFAPAVFLDGLPPAVRASLRPLVGVWSLPAVRRPDFGDCFVCLLLVG